MSLESAIETLGRTMDKLIEIIQQDGALRTELSEKMEALTRAKAGEATTTTKPKSTTTKATQPSEAETLPAEQTAAVVEQQISTSPEDRNPVETDNAVEGVAAEVRVFMEAAVDTADRDRRRAKLQSLLAQLKAPKVSEIKPADAPRLSKAIAKAMIEFAPPAAEPESTENDELI